MARSTYQVRPGRSLGHFYLGVSLHETLAQLKELRLPRSPCAISYSAADPVTKPVLVILREDGIRLRFDGPEQRLRLIEIIDFTGAVFTYNEHDINPPEHKGQASPGGPNYRAVAKVFGPTFPPAYMQPRPVRARGSGPNHGSCILSYPGVAFSFPVDHAVWKPSTDTAALLGSSAAMPATSLSIFHGRAWLDIRNSILAPSSPTLVKQTPPNTRQSKTISATTTATATPSGRHADSITLIKIYGQGRIDIFRPSTTRPISITLSETTPQDLVTELGAPDAIYHKSDRRLSIHQQRQPTDGREGTPEHSTDDTSFEHFFNYFRHGLDILISTPVPASLASPTMPEALLGDEEDATSRTGFVGSHRTVATKLLLHANVPGSHDFGRYARCRWSLEHVPSPASTSPLTSETRFEDIAERMRDVWSGGGGRHGHAHKREADAGGAQAMLVQRGWMSEDAGVGFGLGGSAEVVGPAGSWGDGRSSEDGDLDGQAGGDGPGDGETTRLFGFPGLVFEVLGSGAVGCLTVY